MLRIKIKRRIEIDDHLRTLIKQKVALITVSLPPDIASVTVVRYIAFRTPSTPEMQSGLHIYEFL